VILYIYREHTEFVLDTSLNLCLFVTKCKTLGDKAIAKLMVLLEQASWCETQLLGFILFLGFQIISLSHADALAKHIERLMEPSSGLLFHFRHHRDNHVRTDSTPSCARFSRKSCRNSDPKNRHERLQNSVDTQKCQVSPAILLVVYLCLHTCSIYVGMFSFVTAELCHCIRILSNELAEKPFLEPWPDVDTSPFNHVNYSSQQAEWSIVYLCAAMDALVSAKNSLIGVSPHK